MCLCVCSRQDLSAQCSAQLFDEEVDMAESIDFQIPMKAACRREISSFCKDVPHGHARVIRFAAPKHNCSNTVAALDLLATAGLTLMFVLSAHSSGCVSASHKFQYCKMSTQSESAKSIARDFTCSSLLQGCRMNVKWCEKQSWQPVGPRWENQFVLCRCLQDNLKADNFTQSCKAEVQRYEQTASTDYRCLFCTPLSLLAVYIHPQWCKRLC